MPREILWALFAELYWLMTLVVQLGKIARCW